MNSIFKKWENGSILITDAGWGDSGKGKVVSALIPDMACKVIGGHNAGHTVVTDRGELGLGLVPSSVIHPGVISIIGQEVVINPTFLGSEIDKLKKFGIKVSPKNLLIDPRSHVIMPWHEIRDALSEESRGKAAVGSLHLGVGWTYSDRINRRGLRLSDLFKIDWKDKVKKELQIQLEVIEGMRKDVKTKTGARSKVDTSLNETGLLQITGEERSKLKPYATNTIETVWKTIDKNATILFEDSHGAMLDVSHGSWPFTTGVNTGLAGVYKSFGGKAVKNIKKTIVCVKSYQTRVGGGPMPTEDFGKFGEYVRKKGHEIGTRSGRARRCGPFDLPLISYGFNVLGLCKNDEVAITKLDILSGLNKIPVCTDYSNGKQIFKTTPNADSAFLEKINPKFINLPGWKEDISEVRSFKNLPKEAKNYIEYIQKNLKVKVTFIGVGKHKDAKIII